MEPISPNLWIRIDKRDLARALLTILCMLGVMFGAVFPDPRFPIIAIAGLLIACWPIIIEAARDILQRRMSMELSMLIAIVAAAAIGEWVTSLVIAIFVLIAEILEELCMNRGQESLTDLMTFLPESTQVLRGEAWQTILLSDLRIGDTVLVLPGSRIPCDSEVTGGDSTVDQSHITGEPMPVEVQAGSKVFAGSINQTGTLELRAKAVGEDSSYGRIVQAVKAAQESEPPVMRLADRLASWLIYLALGAATVTFIATRDLPSTISVIVVAGACGVAAGTPLAILAAIARIAQVGAFVKDGSYLEELSRIDTVIFDKTGTLTHGQPKISNIECTNDIAEIEMLRLAASAESYSEHPLAKAIVEHAKTIGLRLSAPENFEYLPGKGVSAVIEGRRISVGSEALVTEISTEKRYRDSTTTVYVAVDGRYAGAISLSDTIRDSARESLNKLRQTGLHLMMLTGDTPENAQVIGKSLGIDDARGELLPEEKVQVVNESKLKGRCVAMVGDGINDAPALAEANVGIAMGSGTDIAQETSDIVLISSDLNDLAQAIRIARRARRIIMFNFFGTIIVDIVGMIAAALGFLTPTSAAFIHVASETLFILNSAKLIPKPMNKNTRENRITALDRNH